MPDIAMESSASNSGLATYRTSLASGNKSRKCFVPGVWVTQNPPVLSTLGVQLPLPAPTQEPYD